MVYFTEIKTYPFLLLYAVEVMFLICMHLSYIDRLIVTIYESYRILVVSVFAKCSQKSTIPRNISHFNSI